MGGDVSNMRLAADIPVFAGHFTSQPLVFAHLLDAAANQGLSPDLDHVEVIARPFERRLAAFFPADTSTKLTDVDENTLVLILPGAHFPLSETQHLRALGRFPGEIRRAPLPKDGDL